MRIRNVLSSAWLCPSQESVLQHFKTIPGCRAERPADARSDYPSHFPSKYTLEPQHAAEVLKVCYKSVFCSAQKLDFLFSFLF